MEKKKFGEYLAIGYILICCMIGGYHLGVWIAEAIFKIYEWCSERIQEKKKKREETKVDYEDKHDYYTGGVKSGWAREVAYVEDSDFDD